MERSKRIDHTRLGTHIYLDKSEVDQLINKLISLRGMLRESSILTIHQSPFADDTYITVRVDGISTDKETNIKE